MTPDVYIGFRVVECPRFGCPHYSRKQAEIVSKKETKRYYGPQVWNPLPEDLNF